MVNNKTSEFENFNVYRISNNSQWQVSGVNSAKYIDYISNFEDYTHVDCNEIQYTSADLIEGICLSDHEINSNSFWSHHKADGSFESFKEIAKNIPEVKSRLESGDSLDKLLSDGKLGKCTSIYFDFSQSNGVRVTQGDGFYALEANGRHRVLAAKALGFDIPVFITRKIVKK